MSIMSLSTVQNGFIRRGLEIISLPSGDGSAVAFLPSFGRVIGVWPEVEKDSSLWINKDFIAPGAQTDPKWDNPGGDWLWLSPETDFFISDINDPSSTYIVPKSVDPGQYTFSVDGNCITLKNEGTIEALTKGISARFKTARTIRPMSGEQLAQFAKHSEIKIAGYEETTSIETEKNCPLELNFWNLVQVPQGGTAMVGKAAGSDYVYYFGNPANAVGENKLGFVPINFSMPEQFKVGFQSNDLSGVIAYYRENDPENASLIVRGFDLNTDEKFIDAPFGASVDSACPVQLFFGADEYPFGELEYHAPSIGVVSGRHSYTGKSYLYAINGPKDALSEVILSLFGPTGANKNE